MCGLRRFIDADGTGNVVELIPVAGDIDDTHRLDAKATLFGPADKSPEGVRVVLNGANYTGHGQCTVIEFVCDMNRTGLEGVAKPAVAAMARMLRLRRDEKKDDEKKGDEKKGNDKDKDQSKSSLTFKSYEYSEELKKDTLQLEWRTRQACEEYVKKGGDKGKDGDKGGKDDSSSHWGFFTWVFIL